MSFKAIVVRFTSEYPSENPHSYVIGFRITCQKNQRSLYKEVKLSYKELKSHGINLSEEKVTEIAMERIKPQIAAWAKEVVTKPSIHGFSLLI